MKSSKAGLIIILTIAFLAGAYFITNPGRQSLTSTENSPKIKLSSLKPESISPNNFDEKKNLTEEIAKAITGQIREKNKDGLNEKDGKLAISVPNTNIISQELSDKFLNGDPLNLFPQIDESKLKISLDNSQENQLKYLINIRNISQNHFGGFNKQSAEILSEVFEKNDFYSVKQLTAIYKAIITDYYQIAVPSSWLDFHKELLSHFNSAKSIYEAIANLNEDPIKTFAAVQSISRIENSNIGVQILLTQGMLKNNLSLKNH